MNSQADSRLDLSPLERKQQNMTLEDELAFLDETIAEPEGRRTDIVNRMDAIHHQATGNVISFPARASAADIAHQEIIWT
jgi:hypothetical protein